MLASSEHANFISNTTNSQVDGARSLDRNPWLASGGSSGVQDNGSFPLGEWKAVGSAFSTGTYPMRTTISWRHEPETMIRAEVQIVRSDDAVMNNSAYYDQHQNSTNRTIEWYGNSGYTYQMYVKKTYCIGDDGYHSIPIPIYGSGLRNHVQLLLERNNHHLQMVVVEFIELTQNFKYSQHSRNNRLSS